MKFGYIQNMVRNYFDHKKKNRDLFYYKAKLGFLMALQK